MWKGGKTDEELGREIIETMKQDAKMTSDGKAFVWSIALCFLFVFGLLDCQMSHVLFLSGHALQRMISAAPLLVTVEFMFTAFFIAIRKLLSWPPRFWGRMFIYALIIETLAGAAIATFGLLRIS